MLLHPAHLELATVLTQQEALVVLLHVKEEGHLALSEAGDNAIVVMDDVLLQEVLAQEYSLDG